MRQATAHSRWKGDTLLTIMSPSQTFALEVIGHDTDRADELYHSTYTAVYMSARTLRDRTHRSLTDAELIRRTRATVTQATQPGVLGRHWTQHLVAPTRTTDIDELKALKTALNHLPFLIRGLAHRSVHQVGRPTHRMSPNDLEAFETTVDLATRRIITLARESGAGIHILCNPRIPVTQRFSAS